LAATSKFLFCIALLDCNKNFFVSLKILCPRQENGTTCQSDFKNEQQNKLFWKKNLMTKMFYEGN